MKVKKSQTTFWQKIKEFILINIWVQKVKAKAFGWRYGLELFMETYDTVKGYITIALFGTVLNQLVVYSTSPTKDVWTFLTPAIWWLSLNTVQSLIHIVYDAKSSMYYSFYYGWYVDELVIKKMQELDWEMIENPKTEKDITESNRSRWSMKNLARTHVQIVTNIIGFVFAFAVMQVHPIIVALIVIKVIPGLFVSSLFNTKSYLLNDSLNLSYNVLGNISHFFRNLKTLFEIKVAAATDTIFYKYKEVQAVIAHRNNTLDNQRIPYDYFIYFYELLFQIGFYYYYINQFLIGAMAIGSLQAATYTIDRVADNISKVLRSLSDSYNDFRYVKYTYYLLTTKNEQQDGDVEFKGDVVEFVFDKVSFKYPQSKRYALKNVNVTISDNSRIALVGENGAGKSTFLKLLTRVHTPTSGEIRLNGIPLQKYKRDSLLKVLSYMTQEFATYSVLTARDNITIYENLQSINEKKFMNAAKMSTSNEFLEKLPNKYDTLLNKMFTEGTSLSTGQWQRLAVGRQFYANRPLVILDEPTSAIDPIAESKIFNNLYEHVKDKTVIVVSHRYNTVRAARIILVFQDGQIIERGNHNELVALDGYYANAYKIQNEEKKL